MAGDWLKFEKATLDKPEVFEISALTGADADAVIGKLLRVWDWFDSQSRDGHAPVTLMSQLDRITGVTGFCQAMAKVGWLTIGTNEIILPNFDRHNGEPSKKRALANVRKQRQRAKGHAESHALNVTETRPEKRREEIPPLIPHNDQIAEIDSVLPRGWRSLSSGSLKSQRVERNTALMVTIGRFFGRKAETLWTAAEAVALRKVNPPADEVALLSRYYAKPMDREQDYRRKDLFTLLNNWTTEIDRATTHFAASA